MANSIHVMKMCQAFTRTGHEVLLLVPDIPLEKDLEMEGQNIFRFYGIDNTFTVKRLPWLSTRGRALLFGLFAALQAKREKAHLFYSRDINSCYCGSLFGLPVIYESHQPINSSSYFYNKLFKKMITRKSFNRLVVISDKLKEYYQQHYDMEEEQLIVAHDGADLPSKELAAQEIMPVHSAEEVLQVGYLGHLYPGKGMEIISALLPRCPWAHFHVVGGSAVDIAYWQKKVERFSNITFHGFKPHSLMAGYLETFQVLLAPYQENVISGGSDIARWMSPLKLFEYMAAAKPIICSDLPVLREVLEDGKDALLCPPEDINCWVYNLKRLKDAPGLRGELGRAAYNKLVNYYTWEKRAENIIAHLR